MNRPNVRYADAMSSRPATNPPTSIGTASECCVARSATGLVVISDLEERTALYSSHPPASPAPQQSLWGRTDRRMAREAHSLSSTETLLPEAPTPSAGWRTSPSASSFHAAETA